MLWKMTRNFLAAVSVCAAGALFCGSALAQQILKSEPPEGQLKPGQRVLVDNGRCPAGQVLEVIGGDNHNKSVGPPRLRRCIPR